MLKTEHYKRCISDFSLDRVVVGGYYDGDMRRKIHRFKFVQNRVDHVYFRSLFAQIEEEYPYNPDIIVYPPISLRDRIFRWPNHVVTLASYLSHDAIIFCPFRKKFFSRHQSRRTKKERSQIREEYFLTREMDLRDKKVLLVDDVITTGYTAHTLGKLLKSAGAKEVVGYFLASEKI